ncbi:acrosin-binding protein-like [Alligator sinensis]|uniref:Acrosin-binding protein n=1 Tax=Alligator sinensis TaxID=38654 RepID=A0A1U8D7S7_ALLSI|nr:acrosin-binding protein-like [Alligator sinensis]
MLAMQVFLVVSVFLNWCSSANSQNKDPPRTGTPLSKEEYVLFFKPLNPPRRASAICLMRALYGCQNPLIKQLDEYENHGVIPQGPICTNIPEIAVSPDFCTFTFYRCNKKMYFAKRVECPKEIQTTLDKSQSPNRKVIISVNPVSIKPPPIQPSTTTATTTKSTPPPKIGSPTPESILRIFFISTFIPQSIDQSVGTVKHSPVNGNRKEVVSRQQNGAQPSSRASHVHTTDLEDLYQRLQDPGVQKLMKTMQLQLTKLAEVGEETLQGTSLKLLKALNHAGMHQNTNPESTKTNDRTEMSIGRK